MKGTTSATSYGFVGKLGCIRFPVETRKVSGIKRGDRLAMRVLGHGKIELLRIANGVATASVDQCACADPPPQCGAKTGVLGVGWSYVRLGDALATELGFLPGKAIRFEAESSAIAVSLHRRRADLEGVTPLPCPP